MYNHAKLINNPKTRNAFGQSPLHFTVRLGDFSMTDKLLQNGAEVNVMDVFGNTPLSLACIEKPNISIIRLLLQYNANVNFDRFYHLDLVLECVLNCRTKKQTDIIQLLIQNGVNINATDRINNRNCLHYAAMTGYTPLAEVLLEKGAFLNIRDNFGYTPLKLAKIHGNNEVLKLFSTHLIRSI